MWPGSAWGSRVGTRSYKVIFEGWCYRKDFSRVGTRSYKVIFGKCLVGARPDARLC